MGDLIYIIPIIAIVAMVAYLVYKFKPKSSAPVSTDDAFLGSVRFCITSAGEVNGEGCLEIDGIVVNDTISTGDVFSIVDKNDNIIDNGVVVEGIDAGTIKSKFVDSVRKDEVVTLHIRTRLNTINGEAFLK